MLNDFIEYCHKVLVSQKSLECNQALDYLHQRNLSDASITENLIGYCSNQTSIPNEIKHYGQVLDDPNKKSYLSFIKGRIIVPILSEFSEVVGFATRKPINGKVDGTSWWNLPFKKGNHLFLLNKSRQPIFEKNKIYIVEGYMDALVLRQEGLSNVVALMGTKLSTRGVSLIARYCDEVCFCLDVDENNSGQLGQDKAILKLHEYGFCNSISVIDNLPIGEDPDVFVMKNGLDSLMSMERLLRAKDIVEINNRIQNA